MLAYRICPTLSLRVIGSERYLFRSRDRKGWETKITQHLAFWQVWFLFSKPLSIQDAVSKVPDDDKEVVTLAIEGMIECGLLEKCEDWVGYDRLLESALFETQPQSVSYHLSSSRVDWVDYSNPKDLKEFDNEKMDEKVREETIPSIYKKAKNSTPSYDLAAIIPPELFGKLASAGTCFGKKSFSSKPQQLTLDHLNFLINMTFAQTDRISMYATGAHVRKAVPSGGARHPTEAYVFVNEGVSDIEPGCYHYNVKFHRLDRLAVSRRHTDRALKAATLVPRARDLPVAAAFVHSCIFERSMFRYRESRSYRVMNFDLGHLHANEVLGAKMLGLAFNECYSVAESEIEAILSLDPLHESVMSSFVIHAENANV